MELGRRSKWAENLNVNAEHMVVRIFLVGIVG
jgi:hypothetical protein